MAAPSGGDSLRIALVCPYSLSRPGGVQGQVVGLARALVRRGHVPTVLAPLDHAADAPAGVDLVVTGSSVGVPANGSVAPITLSLPAVTGAVRTLRSSGFDCIHVHEPFTPGVPYGVLLGRRLPPVVATFHRSGGSALYTVLGPVARRLADRLAVRCAVSEAARSTAEHALGGTYRVGFNGIEVERYRDAAPWPTDGRPVVLFLGRHEERKGLGVLLSAFERAGRPDRADRRDAVLWVAGNGPDTDRLRRRHPESPRLRWLGVVPEEEKERRLAAATALCAPSLSGESFGMVLLEAMAARAVVVASDIDGYRDASGGHAVLVPPGDPDALASALDGVTGQGAGVSGSAAPASRLDRAFRWAEHWSMDRLAGWYEESYRAAMVGD